MAWNGSGAVTLLYDWTAQRDAGPPDSYIDSEKFDLYGEDLAATIEQTLNINGENAMASDVSWGGFKITDLGAATAATDACNMHSVGPAMWAGTSTGSGGAYAVTANVSSVVSGTRLAFIINHTNPGASTLSVNGGGATQITRLDNADAVVNDLVTSRLADLVYDGTKWKIVSVTEQEANEQYQPIDADLTTISGLAKTKGNLIASDGAAWATQGVGTDGYVLQASAASGTGVAWGAILQPGTNTIFYATNAPTGWTAQAINDRALRVVNSGGVGGGLGGVTAWSSVLTSRTIIEANLPSHTHSFSGTTSTNGDHNHASGGEALYNDYGGGTFVANRTYNSGSFPSYRNANTSTAGNHSHTISGTSGGTGSGVAMDFDVAYANVIIAQKD